MDGTNMIAVTEECYALAPLEPAPQPSRCDVQVQHPLRAQAGRLLFSWLSDARKSPATRRTYLDAVRDFAAFLHTDVLDAVAALLAGTKVDTRQLLDRYLTEMSVIRKRAPNSCNARVAALRSLLGAAHDQDLISYALKFKALKPELRRDCRGPTADAVRAMYATITGDTPKAKRDRAIIRTLFSLGLRRSELLSLDLEHVDLQGGTIQVLAKGHKERSRLTLPEQTRQVLAEWVSARGPEPGPLFTSLSYRSRGKRLAGASLHALVQRLGKRVGVHATVHGLRHSAITTALDLTDGNVRDVRRFSRHADLNTVARYDDERKDTGGMIATLVDQTLER
jgi:integrase/recombinase XerC